MQRAACAWKLHARGRQQRGTAAPDAPHPPPPRPRPFRGHQFEFTISWPKRWVTNGYTAFTFGFKTPEEARHWYSRIAECLEALRSASSKNLLRSSSSSKATAAAAKSMPSANQPTTTPRTPLVSSGVRGVWVGWGWGHVGGGPASSHLPLHAPPSVGCPGGGGSHTSMHQEGEPGPKANIQLPTHTPALPHRADRGRPL